MNTLPQFLNSKKGVKDYYFEVVFLDTTGNVLKTLRTNTIADAISNIGPFVKQRNVDLTGNLNDVNISFYPTESFSNVFSRVQVTLKKDIRSAIPPFRKFSQMVTEPTYTGYAFRGLHFTAFGDFVNHKLSETILFPGAGYDQALRYNFKTGVYTEIPITLTGDFYQLQGIVNEETNTYLIQDATGVRLFNANTDTLGSVIDASLNASTEYKAIAIDSLFYLFRLDYDEEDLNVCKIDASIGTLLATYTLAGSSPEIRYAMGSTIVHIPERNKLYCMTVDENDTITRLNSFDLLTNEIVEVATYGPCNYNCYHLHYCRKTNRLVSPGDNEYLYYDFTNNTSGAYVATSDAFTYRYFAKPEMFVAIGADDHLYLFNIVTGVETDLGLSPNDMLVWRACVYRPIENDILMFTSDHSLAQIHLSDNTVTDYASTAGGVQSNLGGWGQGLNLMGINYDGNTLLMYDNGNTVADVSEMTSWSYYGDLFNQDSYDIFYGELAPPINITLNGEHTANCRSLLIEQVFDGKRSMTVASASEQVEILLNEIPELVVDAASFTVVKAADSSTITVTDFEGNYLDLIKQLTWLGAFAIYIAGNTVYAKQIKVAPSALKVVDVEEAFDVTNTTKSESDVFTHVTITDGDGNSITYQRNDNLWGERAFNITTDTNVIFTPEVADAANYWLYQYSVIWKRLQLKLPWRYMGLEPFDTVSIINANRFIQDNAVYRILWDSSFQVYRGDALTDIQDVFVTLKASEFLEAYSTIIAWGVDRIVRLVGPGTDASYKIQIVVRYGLVEAGPYSYAIWESDAVAITKETYLQLRVNDDNTVEVNGVSVPMTKTVNETGGHVWSATNGYLQLGSSAEYPEAPAGELYNYGYQGYYDDVYLITDKRKLSFASVSSSNYPGLLIGAFTLGPITGTGITTLFGRILNVQINLDGTTDVLLETDIDTNSGMQDARYWVGNPDASGIILISQTEVTPAGTYRFVWEPTADVFSKYELDIEKNGSPFYNDATITTLTHDVALTLAENNTYVWKVRGFVPDGGAGGDWSAWSYVSQFRYEEDFTLHGGVDPITWEQQEYVGSYGPEYMYTNPRQSSFTVQVETLGIQLKNGSSVVAVTPLTYFPATYRRILPGEDLTYFVQLEQASGVWGPWVESENYIPHPGIPNTPSFDGETWVGQQLTAPINIPNYASYIDVEYRTRLAGIGVPDVFLSMTFTLSAEETDDQVVFSKLVSAFSGTDAEIQVRAKARNSAGSSEWVETWFRNYEAGNDIDTTTGGLGSTTIDNDPVGGGGSVGGGSTISGGAGGFDGLSDWDPPAKAQQTIDNNEEVILEEGNQTDSPTLYYNIIPRPDWMEGVELQLPAGATTMYYKWIWGTAGTTLLGAFVGPVEFDNSQGAINVFYKMINRAQLANGMGADNLAKLWLESIAPGDDPSTGFIPGPDYLSPAYFPGASLFDWPAITRLAGTRVKVQFYDEFQNKVGDVFEFGNKTFELTTANSPYLTAIDTHFGTPWCNPDWLVEAGPEFPTFGTGTLITALTFTMEVKKDVAFYSGGLSSYYLWNWDADPVPGDTLYQADVVTEKIWFTLGPGTQTATAVAEETLTVVNGYNVDDGSDYFRTYATLSPASYAKTVKGMFVLVNNLYIGYVSHKPAAFQPANTIQIILGSEAGYATPSTVKILAGTKIEVPVMYNYEQYVIEDDQVPTPVLDTSYSDPYDAEFFVFEDPLDSNRTKLVTWDYLAQTTPWRNFPGPLGYAEKGDGTGGAGNYLQDEQLNYANNGLGDPGYVSSMRLVYDVTLE